MSGKRKRNDLSLADKYEVIKLLDQKMPQTQIAKKMGCSQGQVSRISTNRASIMEEYESNSNPERKRHRSGKAADVEDALSTWFTHARSRDIPLSGPVLEEKASDLAKKLDKPDFKPSSGWLSRWKERNNIVFKRQHGEKKDADLPAADSFVANVLPGLLQKYAPDDIYNADETGIYYRALPDGTLVNKSESVAGGKKSKDRITALVATNMSGTDRRKLLIIGKSKQPRCLRGEKSLPVDYESNSNAWMTGEIFTSWLSNFNRDMRLQQRHVLLLVDNCSAHPSHSEKKLTNVTLSFLPPNTTSVIQPCDQGIIRNLKALYRKQVVKKIIDDIDVTELSANDIARRLTLLDAVHMLARAWRAVTPETVRNCFAKAGFKTDSQSPAPEVPIELPESMTASSFDEYVCHDEHVECYGMPSDEDICHDLRQADSCDAISTISDDEDNDGNEPLRLPGSVKEARSGLADIRRFLEDFGCTDFEAFYQLEELVEKVGAASRRQAKITEFVDWIP